MPWFQKLCRQTGLALHGVMHPPRRAELSRTVREHRVDQAVLLRRTVIEEIELTPGHPSQKPNDHAT